MTIRTQRWSPDTCSCVIIQQWDDSLPDNEIVITNVAFESRCPAHINIDDPSQLGTVVLDENRKKNWSFDEILQNAPSTSWFDLDENGNRILKNGVSYNWTWSGTTPNRVLTVTFTGITLTTQQRTNLQNRLNVRFGSGKIILG